LKPLDLGVGLCRPKLQDQSKSFSCGAERVPVNPEAITRCGKLAAEPGGLASILYGHTENELFRQRRDGDERRARIFRPGSVLNSRSSSYSDG